MNEIKVLEHRARLGLLQEVTAHGFGQIVLAEQRTEVEEDGGVEHGIRMRLAYPLTKLVFPFVERQTPLRVAGHNVAFTQREAAAVEVFVDVQCKSQEALA